MTGEPAHSSLPARESAARRAPFVRLAAVALFVFVAFSAAGDQSGEDGRNVATSAPNVVNPANAANVVNGADVLDIRGFAIAAMNDEGDAFVGFRRRAAARLFAALEDELSHRGESALSGFAAIKSADISFQTGLGGRPEQLGAHIIGAFAEQPRRSAFGWQLRVFGGADDVRGANAGVFFRRVEDGFLYGGNLFGDYEYGGHGAFVRYGLGVELENRHFAAAANYYVPLTGDKIISPTLSAFSRQGYDANLRVAVPGARFVNAEASYYYYHGKGGAAADKGLRYGAALSPGHGIILKLFYDDGGGELGGEVSYSHTIGEAHQSYAPGDAFTPDLFAPVWREHSQRITAVSSDLRVSIAGIITTRITTAAMTIRTTTAAGGQITTITRMTAAAVTTTIFMTNTVASRMASVGFSLQARNVEPFDVRTTSLYKLLVTLPAPDTPRPWAYTLTLDLVAALGTPTDCPVRAGVCHVIVVESSDTLFYPLGDHLGLPGGNSRWQITVVEGSEDIISVAMTNAVMTNTMAPITTATTMTTTSETPVTTTITIPPVITTTRQTTYATITTIIGANASTNNTSPLNNTNNKGSNNSGGKEHYGYSPPFIGGLTKPPLAIALSPSSSFPPRHHSRVGRNPYPPLA